MNAESLTKPLSESELIDAIRGVDRSTQGPLYIVDYDRDNLIGFRYPRHRGFRLLSKSKFAVLIAINCVGLLAIALVEYLHNWNWVTILTNEVLALAFICLPTAGSIYERARSRYFFYNSYRIISQTSGDASYQGATATLVYSSAYSKYGGSQVIRGSDQCYWLLKFRPYGSLYRWKLTILEGTELKNFLKQVPAEYHAVGESSPSTRGAKS